MDIINNNYSNSCHKKIFVSFSFSLMVCWNALQIKKCTIPSLMWQTSVSTDFTFPLYLPVHPPPPQVSQGLISTASTLPLSHPPETPMVLRPEGPQASFPAWEQHVAAGLQWWVQRWARDLSQANQSTRGTQTKDVGLSCQRSWLDPFAIRL